MNRSAEVSGSAIDFRPPKLSYPALFWRFLKFGAMAFGGPVAQIAMIRRELVDEEKWISSGHFNRLIAVMQVLPGPEAHELCVHLGIRAKGRLGGLLAGLGFMLPGLLLMLALAWAYTRFPIDGTVLGALFLGVQAAVIALIVRAVHRIGEHVLADRWLWLTVVLAAAASLAGASFWIVLSAAGIAYAFAASGRLWWAALVLALAAVVATALHLGPAGAIQAKVAAASPTPLALFWSGLKGGLLTFGGAYTAIPFIRNDTVGRGWMTDAQFLDGLGLSGILPAPLVIFATFVGFISGGLWGALAVTAGMFLPAFAFSLLFYERLEAVVDDSRLQHVLAGVAAGVVGLIVVTLISLARSAAEASNNIWISLGIAAASLLLLYHWKHRLVPLAVVGLGASAGLLLLR
ncbi:chromate efflux transporter [Sandaracinobacter sp. RS1-74]|uniref:chromate efflux transporter n=1 Tax=Sandaracinobacteroides sayramensis TaxID=2913411 RepID=UPI001EDBF238|nr:chromate efflux transporter [Sandaracinobacteroides sayramensis]MCG2839928.1 chromate efflux transporter [Sandaracinobacteroides sayramensis]